MNKQNLISKVVLACALLAMLSGSPGRLSGADGLPKLPASLPPALPPTVAATDVPAASPKPAAPGVPLQPNGPSVLRVDVTQYMTVDVQAQNVQMSSLLQQLAVKARRNILLASDADRIVSMTLYNVAFYKALDAILETNDLGYIEDGDFIKVFTKADLLDRQQLKDNPISKVITLDYLRADSAKEAATGLLSKVGSITQIQDEKSQDSAAAAAGGAQFQQAQAEDPVYKPEKNRFSVSSAIVVHDYRQNVSKIEALIAELDRRPVQVLLEATILRIKLNQKNAFGVDFAVLPNTNLVRFFGFKSADPALAVPAAGTYPELRQQPSTVNDMFLTSSPGNTGQGPGTFKAGYAIGDIGVFLRALDQISDTTVLSNPKVLALNRQRARLLVGSRVGYLENTVVQQEVIQSVKFLDTGIALDVRPFVLADGRVRLVLAPKISAPTFRDAKTVSGTSQDIPSEDIQTVATDILVPSGGTAIIGGLFRNTTTKSRSQVPVAGDIPVVGAAFQGHDDEVDREEIIFLIKPTIMSESDLEDVGREGMNNAMRVYAGTRLGLLPWSREHQCGQLNLKAQRCAEEGKMAEARWLLRRSIQLNPAQPEAIALQQAMCMKESQVKLPSLLESAVRKGLRDEAVQAPADPEPATMPAPTEPAPAASQPAELSALNLQEIK